MKILFVSAEVSPFAKVGGLADVAGSLPQYLASLGHDVRVVMPCYRMIESNPAYGVKPLISEFRVPINDELQRSASVKMTSLGSTPVYLVANDEFFGESVDSKSVYRPGADPYVFFCRAVLEMIPRLDPEWTPDIIHCNDWHTGLLPVYLRTLYSIDPRFDGIATLYTIHNLAYQGEFEYDIVRDAGLPCDLYSMDKLECYGKVNFLKGGVVFSDLVNTVSKTYACEIQTPEYGCRLDGLLRYMSAMDKVRGALNGIDYDDFNPETDKRIWANFSADDMSGKAMNKAGLQESQGLPARPDVPLFGLVSRLVDQKGLDLIRAVAPHFMRRDVQMIVLGTGDPAYEEYFKKLEAKYPEKMKANIGFDAVLAQGIYAGCDFFLMPSRFEPCGLGQMISLRYGTIPIVRTTGGLADTIVGFDVKSGVGNGFTFCEYESGLLNKAIQRALEVYSKPDNWSRLLHNAMACDFSGANSAQQYAELYAEAIHRVRSRPLCLCA